jgi:hypothetical protein
MVSDHPKSPADHDLVIPSFRSSPEVVNSFQMTGFPSRKVLRRSWIEAGL